METCPKCKHDTLIYDPHTKSARCLQMECQYKEQMDYSQYSRQFENGEKNIVSKLAFPRNHVKVGECQATARNKEGKGET